MPSSSARATARSWSAGSPLTISPPTAPQPNPSSEILRPVLPNLRFSTDPSCAAGLPPDKTAPRTTVSTRGPRPSRQRCDLDEVTVYQGGVGPPRHGAG